MDNAVNGTLVDEGAAKRLEASGIKRVSHRSTQGTKPVTTSFVGRRVLPGRDRSADAQADGSAF